MPYSIVFPCPDSARSRWLSSGSFCHLYSVSHLYVATGEGNLSPQPPPVGYSQTHTPLACLGGPHSSFRPGPNAAAHICTLPLFLPVLSQDDTDCTIQLAPANPLWSLETKVQALASPSLGALGQGVRTLVPPCRVCPLAA